MSETKNSRYLILNGLKFAKNERAFVESLFDKSGTCRGFYKQYANGVRLFDHQSTLRAFLAVQRQKYITECFIVTAQKLDDGRVWYMHSLSSLDEQWLNMDGLGYVAQHDVARAAWESIS